MAATTEQFSGEALRASLRERLLQVEHGGREQFGWSEADLELAAQLCGWLETAPRITVALPSTGIGAAGLPELDWSALTPEQLGRATASAGRGESPLSWADLRIAIRERLTERADRPGRMKLRAEDARCLLELYEYLIHQRGEPVDVPTDDAIRGQHDLDWNRISAEELARRVRRAHSEPAAREGAPDAGRGADANDSGAGARGATVRDLGSTEDHEPLSYAAFAALRAERRRAQAQRLLEARVDFRRRAEAIREAHLHTAQDLLADRTMPRTVRAEALRHHRRTLRCDLGELARQRGELLGGGQPWYERLVEGWRDERGDRRDYARLLRALYDDRTAAARAGADRSSVGVDPVLVAIAGVRRHREGGALVYTQRSAGGPAELFRVCEDTREVVVRTPDRIATEAAIVRAYGLAGPPLTFAGSAQFQARCEAIAARHGFEVATRERDVATAPAGAPGAAAGTAAASTSAPAAPMNAAAGAPGSVRAAPLVELADYGEIVALVKEQSGVDYVVALDPKHGVPMKPVYLSHTPLHEGPYELVFVQTPGVEVISAIVLPRGCVPAAAVGGETRVQLEIENGGWRAAFDLPAPTRKGHALAFEVSRSRGR